MGGGGKAPLLSGAIPDGEGLALGFESLHLLGQMPQRLVDLNAAVNSFNLAALWHPLPVLLPLVAVALPALDAMFLHDIQRGPCVGSLVLDALRRKQQFRSDRGFFNIPEADNCGSFRKDLALAFG